MASCSLGGSSNIKFLTFRSRLTKTNSGGPETLYGIGRIWTTQKPVQVPGLSRQSWRSATPLTINCSSSEKSALDVAEDSSEVKKSVRNFALSEVQYLITELCETTSIAEIKLKLGGSKLYITRDLDGNGNKSPSSALSSPPFGTTTSIAPTDLNGHSTTSSLTVSKSKYTSEGIQNSVDTSQEEGLDILPSPKVGFFKRSRTINGKRMAPSCKEGQEVLEGQVLCYIEQLGVEIPVESDVSGEVVKILREDGEPVGYGDGLISILPSFPGIKKLQP
ncbi:hypothetical protein QJS10_CPA07g00602 [Acorus calamus]|uniref:Lipoyl-binding domain-containing protein n=1 Tax=Acorus calamus TaxID=4465 RepID=A0AAV9EG21_ACOCL|nr:hypothetical protein QJS10_CPA07g00602 [Acorus calamus]